MGTERTPSRGALIFATALAGLALGAGAAEAVKVKRDVKGQIRYDETSDGVTTTGTTTIRAKNPACRNAVSSLRIEYLYLADSDNGRPYETHYVERIPKTKSGWSLTAPTDRVVPVTYAEGPLSGQPAGTRLIKDREGLGFDFILASTGKPAPYKDRSLVYKVRRKSKVGGQRVTEVVKCTLFFVSADL